MEYQYHRHSGPGPGQGPAGQGPLWPEEGQEESPGVSRGQETEELTEGSVLVYWHTISMAIFPLLT